MLKLVISYGQHGTVTTMGLESAWYSEEVQYGYFPMGSIRESCFLMIFMVGLGGGVRYPEMSAIVGGVLLHAMRFTVHNNIHC